MGVMALLFAWAVPLVRMEPAALRLFPACLLLCVRVFCCPISNIAEGYRYRDSLGVYDLVRLATVVGAGFSGTLL